MVTSATTLLVWLLCSGVATATETMASAFPSTVPVPEGQADSTQFADFVAHNKTMTCSADEHARPFNNQIRGVNLGGWMVLEPWITPSLFYQFLGKGENTTAFDTYSFCQVLGPEEANRQLRNHWEKWVTKEHIVELAQSGAVNSLRLPIGDFMFKPYGPYVGCYDGALDYVMDLLDWAYANGLSVLLDIHTMKGSQNGFDNSGQTLGFEWTSNLAVEYANQVSFQHWPIRDARWVGHFDPDVAQYTSINYDNLKHSLEVIDKIVDTYGTHPAVLGLEPVNEPWQYTPVDILKRFYWEGYLIVKSKAPYWKFIMHDSFRLDPGIWAGFMDGCPERALDTHIYQAWRDPDSRIGFYTDACGAKGIIAYMEQVFGPVVVGEWSLATDNCAMWLNGFNDNLPGFPRLPCKYEPCAESYLGEDQPGVPLDGGKPLQGPFGTGLSGPIYGLCPATRDWIKESSGNPLTGRDWIRAPPDAPPHLDDTDHVMRNLATKKLNAFSGVGHGFYFWNFRTDLDQPQWSYMEGLRRGWIPRGNLFQNEEIDNACLREDAGDYVCVLKTSAVDNAIQAAVGYALNVQNITGAAQEKITDLTGDELRQTAEPIISDYFKKYKSIGATCDFGGVAMLVEQEQDRSDDGFQYTDDEYFGAYGEGPGPGPLFSTLELTLGGVLVGLVGILVGFISAMHFSPGFNRAVRESVLFKPVAGSDSNLLRASFNLPPLESGEQQPLVPKDVANEVENADAPEF